MIEIHTVILSDTSVLRINQNEALRYMGAKEADLLTLGMLCECEAEAKGCAEPRAAYVNVPISINGEEIDFGFMRVKSRNLAKNLDGCDRAYVFAATLGIAIERQFKKISAVSQSRAMVYSAVCSALVESFCDYVNDKLAKDMDTNPRFSCGYGDFGLEHQKEILDILQAGKRLGICLTDSYMMVPVKSVTAIIGIRR